MSEREGVMGREVRVSLEQDCTWLFEKAFLPFILREMESHWKVLNVER